MSAPALQTSYEGNIQWAWDATSLKRASTCARKYYYENICGWQAQSKSVHLWFGGIYASSLELFHKLRAQDMPREEAILDVILYALTESWDFDLDAQGELIPSSGSPRTFDNQYKTRENLIRSLVWYFEEWRDERVTTLRLQSGEPAVELSFRIPLDDDIFYCGHLDQVVQDEDGNIFIHDQKTTTQGLGSYYWNQFKPDIQFAGYTFAGKTVLNTPINGIFVDACQVLVGSSRYGRMPIFFQDAELNEWYDEVMELVERFRGYAEREYWPRDTTACGNYGGCEFRHICSRPPEFRDNFLRGDFTKAPRWDPIKPR